MDSSGSNGGSGRRSKVAALIEEYDLGESFGERLESLWTRTEDRRSLRELADLFNKELLTATLDSAGVTTVDGEVENLYRLLTADDVSVGARTEARGRLEREGIDVDRLESNFVTYQAIRSYLKDHRDAEYEPSDRTDGRESAINNIKRLRARVGAVVEGTLERLLATDRITLGEFRVFVSIEVLCTDCGTQHRVVQLLQQRGCDCDGQAEE